MQLLLCSCYLSLSMRTPIKHVDPQGFYDLEIAMAIERERHWHKDFLTTISSEKDYAKSLRRLRFLETFSNAAIINIQMLSTCKVDIHLLQGVV